MERERGRDGEKGRGRDGERGGEREMHELIHCVYKRFRIIH